MRKDCRGRGYLTSPVRRVIVSVAVFSRAVLGVAGGARVSEEPGEPASDYDLTLMASLPGPLSSAYQAPNPAQGLRTYFHEAGIRVAPLKGAEDWTLELALSGYGFAGDLRPLESIGRTAEGIRIEYSFLPGLHGWFVNGKAGLEQGLVLASRPRDESGKGERPLHLEMDIRGDLSPKFSEDPHVVDFYFQGKRVLRYGDLRAADAKGREVPVHMELPGDRGRPGRTIRIIIDRTEATYPVTVEGLLTSAKGGRAAARLGLGDGSPAALPPVPEVAPANDACGGAEVIPNAGPFPYATAVTDIASATTTGDPVSRPPCAFGSNPVSRSVWYQFTPAASGTYTFTTCADAPTETTVDDPVMAIYTSASDCAGPFTQVSGACDDDSCSFEVLQPFVSASLVSGTAYYVVVWNLDPAPTPGNGSLQLLVTASLAPSPPPNDTCGGAEVIAPAGPFPYLTAVTADITDATTTGDPPAPSCKDAFTSLSRSLWYAFTPATSGSYVLSSCRLDPGGTATTVTDDLIAVYASGSGCGGPFTEIPTQGLSDGCDDDLCGTDDFQATLSTYLDAGTTYYVVVSKVGSAAPAVGHTAVQLRVEQVSAPGNDTCGSATAITLNSPVAGSNEHAGDDYRAPLTSACFSGVGQSIPTASLGRDVVYSFTAPDTGLYSFRATGFLPGVPAKNLLLYVASDCPATAPAEVSCLGGANRSPGGSSEEVECLPLNGGTTARIFVDEPSLSAGSPFTLEVNRCTKEAEPNNTPDTASSVACGIEGAISPAGEADFFSLGSPLADSRVFAFVDGVAGNSSDFDMRVTTSTDTLEYDDLNVDVPFGALSPTCAGTPTPLTAEAPFLRVSLFGGGIAEPYRLYSVVRPPLEMSAAESEPNDTPAQANESPEGYYSGALDGPAPSTDVDVFSFQAAQGDLIYVGLDGDPQRDATPINAALSLLDSVGGTLVAVNDGAATSSPMPGGAASLTKVAPIGPAEGLTWRARYTGRYLARVAIGTASTGPTGAGDYLLSVSRNCVSSDVDGDGAADSDDCRPNDPTVFAAPGEATSVRFGPGKTTLSWSSAGGGTATTHDVLRGSIGALPVGPGGGDEICFSDVASTSTSDGASPSSGEGFWYVVRGVNVCGTGSYGFAAANGVPTTEQLSTSCP